MIGANAARLELPSDWSIHNVFHVSLLRVYKGSAPPDKDEIYKNLKITGGTPVYTPKSIVSHKVSKKLGTQYLIQWAETP
jgi:hypothetical protein